MTKDEYHLNIALNVAKKSTCLKKQYGAIIVNDDIIVAAGFNRVPREESQCILHTKISGHKDADENSSCPAVQAELNAIVSAHRVEMLGSTLYLAGYDAETGEENKESAPCGSCLLLIKLAGLAGINRVVTANGVLFERDVFEVLQKNFIAQSQN